MGDLASISAERISAARGSYRCSADVARGSYRCSVKFRKCVARVVASDNFRRPRSSNTSMDGCPPTRATEHAVPISPTVRWRIEQTGHAPYSDVGARTSMASDTRRCLCGRRSREKRLSTGQRLCDHAGSVCQNQLPERVFGFSQGAPHRSEPKTIVFGSRCSHPGRWWGSNGLARVARRRVVARPGSGGFHKVRDAGTRHR